MTPLLPFAAVIVVVQTAGQAGSAPPAPSAAVAAATAQRAQRAPVIDGKDDDEVWRQAVPIGEFRQFRPVEDADPSLRTEAKVAYDEHNFYAFIRAFDPAPAPPSRRYEPLIRLAQAYLLSGDGGVHGNPLGTWQPCGGSDTGPSGSTTGSRIELGCAASLRTWTRCINRHDTGPPLPRGSLVIRCIETVPHPAHSPSGT